MKKAISILLSLLIVVCYSIGYAEFDIDSFLEDILTDADEYTFDLVTMINYKDFSAFSATEWISAPANRAILTAILINDFEYSYQHLDQPQPFKFSSLIQDAYIGLNSANQIQMAVPVTYGYLVFVFTPSETTATCYEEYGAKDRIMEIKFAEACGKNAYKVPKDQVSYGLLLLAQLITGK